MQRAEKIKRGVWRENECFEAKMGWAGGFAGEARLQDKNIRFSITPPYIVSEAELPRVEKYISSEEKERIDSLTAKVREQRNKRGEGKSLQDQLEKVKKEVWSAAFDRRKGNFVSKENRAKMDFLRAGLEVKGIEAWWPGPPFVVYADIPFNGTPFPEAVRNWEKEIRNLLGVELASIHIYERKETVTLERRTLYREGSSPLEPEINRTSYNGDFRDLE